MGRTKLKASDRLHVCCFRATLAEWKQIRAAAKEDGIKTSKWIREVLLSALD